MATLFNTKIKDTYQSLLKLEDNTILTTTSKNITDGLGNASPLYLSTTQVRIGSNSGSAMYWDNTNNRLGIGTNVPSAPLEIRGANFANVLRIGGANTGRDFLFNPYYATSTYGGFFSNESGNITLGASLGTDNGSGIGIILGAPSGTRTALLQVKGTGSTSATTSLLVQNSAGNERLRVYDDGTIFMGNTNPGIYTTFGYSGRIGNDIFESPSQISRYTSGQLTFFGKNNNANAFTFDHNNQQASNSTGISMINLGGGYENQSSFEFANLRISPTYNFNANTTTAAIARGIYYNPTITNLRVATHRALELTSGDLVWGSGYAPYLGNANEGFIQFSTAGQYGSRISLRPSGNQGGFGTNSYVSYIENTGYSFVVKGGNYQTTYLGGDSILFTDGNFNERARIAISTGNLLVGTTTDNGYKLNVNGSINIAGGNKLNFSNGSAQCWITNEGGTGLGSRSILIPGTGGGGGFVFYSDAGGPITSFDASGDSIQIRAGNSSVTGIMSINKSPASGYGGGTFIYYQTNSSNRIYTFGNPSSERSDETGVHTKIVAGAGGTVGSGTYGNGGNIYLEGGAAAFGSNTPGSILISTGVTGSKVSIGEASPTARLQVKGLGSTSATTALLVQDSGSSQLFKIADNGWTTINSRLYLLGDTIYNSSSQPALGVGGTMYMQSNTGIDFSWQNLVQGRFSFTSNVNTNNSVGSPKNSLYTSHTINDGAASSLTEFRSMAVLDTMNMTTFPLTTFIGLFISPTIVSSTTKVRAIQSTIGGAYFNTSSVNASAILQADSTTQGFLPPRVTTIQKNAIATPAEGLMVYDTDLKRPCFFDGTSWITL